MKNPMKWWVRLCYIALFPTLLLSGCKKDDNGFQQELQSSHEHQQHSTSERVDAADIPEIMDFVRQQSNGDLKFRLEGKPGTREVDLTDVEVITSNILAMTNEAEMTNYSFKMDANEANDDEVVNFVVKEKSDGVYGYIIRYRPTQDWLVNKNWNEYSGDMLFYESDGTYVAMQTLDLGYSITNDLRFPCIDNGDGSSSGGSNGGPSGDSGPGSTGSNGSSGTGGGGIVTILICGCTGGSAPHTGGNQTTGCDCSLPDLTIIEIRSMDVTGEIENYLRTADPCDPVEECYDEFLDPCVCAPDGVTCLEEEEENEEVGININLADYMLANEIEENIISTNLDPCSNTILTELKNLTQNDIREIIVRFDVPSTAYNWEIKTAIPLISPSNAAETDWQRDGSSNPIDYSYLTHLNPSYISQANKISIARTILHELLHTYLISLVDDASNPGGSNDVTNFPILWNAFVNGTYDNNPNQLQHEIIGRKFIEPLRDSLKEWDNAQQPDQYYEDLAWGALENTGTFNALFPQGSIDRERIIATNRAEDTNNTATEGTQTVSPSGNPC